MRLLYIKPQIFKFDKFDQFSKEFVLGKGDLVYTNEFIYHPFIKPLNLQCDFMFQEKYGIAEPSNTMIDNVLKDMGDKSYKRIIAIGGGSVIDIGKLMVLKKTGSALELFEKRVPIVKEKELIIIPTTCGTGSEVTNLSIAEIEEKKIKIGLAIDELYADQAILIPELVRSLPYNFFVFSSIDALIHAIESYVSPKSTCYTKLFSVKAIEMIMNGYHKIIEKGQDYRYEIIDDFLIASNYAGIAFGNSGVGAVHALSYPLGGSYHVPHGEANYQFFTEVFKTYNNLVPNGKIKEVNKILAGILGKSSTAGIYDEIDKVLDLLISKHKLKEFGMKKEEIELFADSVIKTQQRLLANNYVPLTREQIVDIYVNLY